MYSIPSEIENTNENDIRLKLNSESFEWSNLIESELKRAIFTSASNKASRSNQLTFLIVQKAYNSISDVFFMLYFELINRDHHLVCWRKKIEAILKKSNKSDYTVSKAYRIITFLNCLDKISKKIIASRLSFFEQTSDLLDLNQMSERKELSAVDVVMNLTHDIELSLKEKKSTTCVFLDIKNAYDYVSIKQLLNVMKKLHLSSQTLRWVKEFMNNRSIELAFDEKKQKKKQIRTEISQESSISSILFLIYTRFLFAKLKIDVNIATSSFIDDIVIYTLSKRIEINCERLNQAISKAFEWARENVIKFDDSKSEMIHFELKKEMSSNAIILSNETTLKSQKSVKWLEIHIDRKLNFKEHVNKRVANATKALHSISRL
jgi:hypothetical protein